MEVVRRRVSSGVGVDGVDVARGGGGSGWVEGGGVGEGEVGW